MKNYAYLMKLVIIVCVIWFCFYKSYAEIYGNSQCIVDEEAYSPSAIQPSGKFIPSNGTFHMLVVFTELPDDAWDVNNPNWPKGEPPAYLRNSAGFPFLTAFALISEIYSNVYYYRIRTVLLAEVSSFPNMKLDFVNKKIQLVKELRLRHVNF